MNRPVPIGGGFTLIEVLVALAIVAFGMGALMSTLTSAGSALYALREKSLAEWVGLNQLSTTRLQLAMPNDVTSEGDVPMAGTQWHWQQSVERLDIPGVHRITVRVRALPAAGSPDAPRPVPEAARSAGASGNAGAAAEVPWVATVVGFRGEAIAAASGEQPDWHGQDFDITAATGGTGAAPAPPAATPPSAPKP